MDYLVSSFSFSLILGFALTKYIKGVFISHTAVTNMEHPSQPQRGLHAKMLWKCSTSNEDPEPVFAPSAARPCLAPIKAAKRSGPAHPSQQVKVEVYGLFFPCFFTL